MPELLGFVRTVTDRTTWRNDSSPGPRAQPASLRTRLSSRRTGRCAYVPPPDHEQRAGGGLATVARRPGLPPSSLLKAGSKAELARRAGVSRAAVTQRVQRIRNRVADLTADAQMRHEVWLSQAARRVVTEESR